MAITDTSPVVPGRWRSLAQVFILHISIFAFFGVAGVVDKQYQDVFFLLGMPLAALMSWLFMRKEGRIGNGLGLKRPESWPKTILIGILSFIVLLLALKFVLNPLVSSTLGTWWDPAQFDPLKGDTAMLAVNVLFVAFFHAAFCEEVIFRGFIFQRLERAFGGSTSATVVAVVLQGALFGLAHLGNGVAAFVETGLGGILFGVMFIVFRRNLWANIIAHALLDTTIFTLVYFGQHRFLLPG